MPRSWFDDPANSQAGPTDGPPRYNAGLPPGAYASSPDYSVDPATGAVTTGPTTSTYWGTNAPKPGSIMVSGQQPTDPTTGQPYDPHAQAPGPSSDLQAMWDQAGHDPQAFVKAYIASKNLVGHQTDPSALNDIAKALQSVGVNATLDQRSDQYHKGLNINGSFVKMLNGSDQWIYDTSGGSGGSSSDSSSGLPVTPFSYAPFTDTFSYAPFEAPTAVTEQNDPGYQGRLQFGSDTLQHSAAAKGTLLSGQTANDLNQYAQNFASNEFGNVYGRAANTYATNYQNALQSYAQKWNQYQQGWQNAFQGWGANANLAETNWSNAFNAANQQFGWNQQNWQNQFGLAQLGLNAANASANAGANYAGNAGNLITGAGNAGAAGTVGAGNAWANGLNSLANYGQNIPYMRNLGIYGTTPFQSSTMVGQ